MEYNFNTNCIVSEKYVGRLKIHIYYHFLTISTEYFSKLDFFIGNLSHI